MSTGAMMRARVFVSHNHSDKEIARKISESLIRDGHEVWLDEWEMLPGDSLITKISEGITNSSYLLVILSKRSVESSWVNKELEVALHRQIKDKRIKVVPCLIEDCDVPLFLDSIIYADFRLSFEDGLEKLLPAIQPVSLKSFGRESGDSWIHDRAIDLDFPNPITLEYGFCITIISHYPIEECSVLFVFDAKGLPGLKARFEKYPHGLDVHKIGVFSDLIRQFVDNMGAMMESKAKNASVALDGALKLEEEYTIVDAGEEMIKIKIFSRRLGEIKDNIMIYSYGDLIEEYLDRLDADLKNMTTEESNARFRDWVLRR